ncbi:hypothetical protein LR48_Vigan07g277400 [Vigna angularis]|uniref:Uncharacterized protein n=2 Tax=Phaseolus angularis TaxID=3914 RepID=A0A0L9V1T6_PHAAN|nr:uncharacterized protein LOC108338440 [Vigna angularis]KAG2390558.1 uncharacterized protein HKW66_Vig0220360 [Vigna angularis]KOM49070.1 hypothetical protein LR48_Vigan07g277400 [Vigna angularis]BAT82862.1 hypothetical protein VIGAN_03293100 [Vigna angularis var. angularis]
MSRCFPFPPPGYGARSEALIESIKLREEIEKKRREKIEKKRIKKEKKRAKEEKKEIRKEKKERKHKEGTTAAINGSDDDKKFKLINDIKETKADGKLQKGEVCDNELLERSGITEELEQPVTSREPCCLSDSTQSSKRKRGSPQATHENGPAIKIRLPLRKHSDPEELNSKSKFNVRSSSGNVGDSEHPLNKTGLATEHQSKCVTNTGPKGSIGKSDSSSDKVLQSSFSGNAVVTKSTVGSDSQSQYLRTSEPKRVVGNLDSRHPKSVHSSVRPDVVVVKDTIGNDSQSLSLRTTEFKRGSLGNSVSRHGNAMQNSVHGDCVVVKNTVGSERQSQSLRTAVPNGILGKSQCLQLKEPKQVLSNSGKVIHNSIHGDSTGAKSSTLQNDPQTLPKRVNGNSAARHGKAVQNLVHGEVLVTKNTPGSYHQSKCLAKPKRVPEKPDSEHEALQNIVHGDAVVADIAVDDAMVTDKAVDAMDIDKVVGDAMEMVKAVDDGSKRVESLYKSLLLIPPLMYDGFESLDEGWLFSSEAEAKPPASKKQKCDSDVFKLSSSMWPRAEYFPEVDVYALPYAVPF